MILVRDIQRAVAKHYDLPVSVMYEPDTIGARTKDKVRPRQMAMLLSRRLTRRKYTEIGRVFRRDHSTIITGCRAARRRCLADRQHLRALCDIRARVLGNG